MESIKNIKGIEAKFIIHKPGKYDRENWRFGDDIHYVKEKIHYTDGTYEKRLKRILNYERPFWITLENYRNHKSKKEQEDIKYLSKHMSTETELWKNIATRLGSMYLGKTDKRSVCDNPYIYGCDVNSRVFLKKEYLTKYPDTFSRYDVATLDIETDIDTNTITMVSIAREWEIVTIILKDFISKELDYENRLNGLFKKYIPLEHEVKVTYKVVDEELDILKEVMKVAHEWQPDLLAVWNLDYEITMFMELCKKYNVNIEDYFSDPSIPKEDRFFVYKRGKDFKVTASGKRHTFEPKDKWNVVIAPSSFYWIDPMCTYNFLRTNSKKVPTGYSLDSILGHELGSNFKKLKFPHLTEEGLNGAEWHKNMSKFHPLEYIIYNQWDVLSMLVLDAKIKDLNTSLPVLSDINPYDIFNSGPKKIVNQMLFVGLENGVVLGTNGMNTDEEHETLGLNDWIITLANKNLSSESTIKCVEESDKLDTTIRLYVADADQESGYPNNIQTGNVSKATTWRELLSVDGIDKEMFKKENINLLMGPSSHIQYCQIMLNFPSVSEVDEYITEAMSRR